MNPVAERKPANLLLRHVKALERRQALLVGRVMDPKRTPGSKEFDKSELSALNVAIALMRELHESRDVERIEKALSDARHARVR
jgi:hypothetical protein